MEDLSSASVSGKGQQVRSGEREGALHLWEGTLHVIYQYGYIYKICIGRSLN